MNFIGRILGKDSGNADPYGAPGSGKSLMISLVTVVVLFFAWWLITSLGVIKPLFLPAHGETIGAAVAHVNRIAP